MKETLPVEGGISDIVEPAHVAVGKESLLQRLHKPVRAALGGTLMFLVTGGITPSQTHAQENPDQANELVLSPEEVAGISTDIITGGEPPPLPEFDLGYRNPDFRPQVNYYPDFGIVAVESSRITHQYDSEAGWQELENYIPLGNAWERINNNLIELLSSRATGREVEHIINPLGLDEEEVNYYIETGDDKGLQSFQVLNNSKGEPAFIVVTGGEYGLKPELGNLQSLKEAVKRLNEIDPNMIDLLTIQFGMRAFAGFLPGVILPFGSATFDSRLGVIELNEVGDTGSGGRRGYTDMISTLIVEARHIYNKRHLEYIPGIGIPQFTASYRLSDSAGVDKALFLKQWAEQHKARLTQPDYANIVSAANVNERYYLAKPYLN